MSNCTEPDYVTFVMQNPEVSPTTKYTKFNIKGPTLNAIELVQFSFLSVKHNIYFT
jgi:hypothetical protein